VPLPLPQTVPLELQDSENGFMDNAAAHFRNAGNTIGKDDRDFVDSKSGKHGLIFHFDLKGITYKADLVEV
jgi:hypothetical protein